MLRTLRNTQREDEGFTLIELLVVVIIIGILAAIAIPVFLNQREKARNASANSDLRNLITAQEGVFTESDAYTATLADLKDNGFTQSVAVVHCVSVGADGDTFTAETYHPQGTLYFYYESQTGIIVKGGSVEDGDGNQLCETGQL
ncbi:MAG TPA: prepilin-type N-terminal cleavage/methylation domain-containing protein [Nitriliruptorales bacterium]